LSTHLVIPDSHAHPDYSNERFTWLGRLIVDLKPDVVIHLGDFVDMPSLCTYEERTREFEGRRYHKDVTSAIDAQEKLFAPIKAAKKKRPRFILLEGNHEHRISRAVNTDHHKLDGVISIDDLEFDKFGWEFISYNGATPGIVIVDGVAYAHYFASGIMNRAIGGEHPAYQMLMKQYMSCTQGHMHTTDFCIRTKADGDKIYGLVAGVYQDYYADWAGEANELWWRGVVVKRNVNNGMYDPEWIGIDRIRRQYG